MNGLLKWILNPAGMFTLQVGGGGGGGDGGAAERKQEEERKAALRARIDKLYGIATREKVQGMVPFKMPILGKVKMIPGWVEKGGAEAEAAVARQAMENENTQLAEATRGYYADQLGDDYQEAERNTRFKLARQGLLGSSEEVGQLGEVQQDRDLGATRVDEAVRRAIATLTSQREQERLNAINLVNSGAGESAVSAASAGLRNSFESVASQQKADIFGDLFSNTADAFTAGNVADQQAALLSRYRDKLSSFFPNRGSTTSGRVTPSA